MNHEYRQLRVDKLIETADRLAARVGERFPRASLGRLAAAVADVTRDAVSRAETIRRPDWLVRGGLLLLGAALFGLAVAGVVLGLREPGSLVERLLEILRATQGALVFLSAVVVFLWTLETRLKRARAVRAVHELRALAHIIDLHQLSKDPESGPTDDPAYNRDARRQYLHYCTELLALVSKIGQLYVQEFPDATTLATVDQFENLATGLSQKILAEAHHPRQRARPLPPRPGLTAATRTAAPGRPSARRFAPFPGLRRPPRLHAPVRALNYACGGRPQPPGAVAGLPLLRPALAPPGVPLGKGCFL